MNCASHPELDERINAEGFAARKQRHILRSPASPLVPSGPNKPDEWRFTKICERGAWFCPRCYHFQFAETSNVCQNPRCDHSKPMRWEPPIY